MSKKELRQELASFERWMGGRASGIDFKNCAFFIRRSGAPGFEGCTIAEIAATLRRTNRLIEERQIDLVDDGGNSLIWGNEPSTDGGAES